MQARYVTGLVLAGGDSTRMGRDKAFFDLGGETLLERQIRVLRDSGLERILVSLPPHLDVPGSNLTVIRDDEPGMGPLAGIVAALEHAPRHPLFVLAVDMPGVSRSLVRTILRQATREAGVVPKASERWEPLCAIYPAGVLDTAKRHLRGRHRSPSRLAAELAREGRVRAHPIPAEEAWSLRSWNRPDDFPRESPGFTDSGDTTDT